MELKRNYHSHTARCGHAIGADEDYIRSAIEAGFEMYGISDHAAYDNPCDRERMRIEQVEEYLGSVASYKEKYKDQIQIYCGMEIENYTSQMKTLMQYRRVLDYCILGQHSLELDTGSCYGFSSPEQILAYTDKVVNAMEIGLVDYIAHPDLPMFGYPQWDAACDQMADRICRASVAYDIPLELNTGVIRCGKMEYPGCRRYAYPTRQFFAVAEKYQCKIMIGLDLHDPAHIRNTYYREEALKVVDGLNLNFSQNEDIIGAAARRKKALFDRNQ